MKKRCIVVLTILLLGIGLYANGVAETQQATVSQTMEFTDSAGRTVTIPKTLTKVAPSGSVAQMILYTIAPDAMVGWSKNPQASVTKYIDPKYWELPEFGQFYGKNVSLNMEALVAANPQVIIDLGDMKATHAQDMDMIQEQTGIPTIFIEANLDTFPQAYRTLGTLFGQEQQGERLASYIEQTVEEARKKAATIAKDDQVGVFFGTGPTGLNANAKGSIHADVLDLVGADNVTVVESVSNKGGGNPINMEQLMRFDPDAIILSADGAYEKIPTDSAWQGLRAVKDDAYYEIPGEPYNWLSSPPSVNRIIGIKWLGNLLYPSLFDYDMVKEAQTFYSLFWHYDLSVEEAESLLAHSQGKR